MENAYFIKTREKGYEDKTIKEIVRNVFLCRWLHHERKERWIVNMGGFLNEKELYDEETL